jgi:cytochrome P450 PksS
METQQVLGADMYSADFKAHAFPVYAAMRAEAPLTRVELPDGRTLWMITRYAEAVEFFKDYGRFANDPRNALTEEEYAQLFADATQGFTPEQQELAAQVDTIVSQQLLEFDPPDHSRLRRLVAIPFTPKYIEGLRPRIEAIAAALLDAAEARVAETGRREMELINEFAYPLPLTVIADMLGIPPADRERFRVWSQAAVSFTPADPPNAETTARMIEFIAYMRELVAAKREHPGDDLTSGLVLAEAEGDTLSENELLGMIFLLIVAGHETTVNLIGNGMLALFDHPAQYAHLRENLDPKLVKPAVEEMLRWYGPVEMNLVRWVRADTEFGGEALRRGEEIVALLAAVNRDPEQFPDPETFDLTRAPNRHLAFGTGLHACLGAVLARLEGQIAFTALLSRLPNLALAIPRDEVEWRAGTFMRGLTRLPVTY